MQNRLEILLLAMVLLFRYDQYCNLCEIFYVRKSNTALRVFAKPTHVEIGQVMMIPRVRGVPCNLQYIDEDIWDHWGVRCVFLLCSISKCVGFVKTLKAVLDFLT